MKLGMILVFFMCLILIVGCEKEAGRGHEETFYIVKGKTVHQSLFYSGTVQPIEKAVVQSQTDGVIIKMFKQYGERVKKGDLLFIISSSKFLTDYKTALFQYIKSKNEFHQSESQLKEATFLYQHQLIPKDELSIKKATFYANQLALIQAKDALKNLMDQMDIKDDQIFNLTLSNIEAVKQAMHFQNHTEQLKIISSHDGILLTPSKSEDENKKIQPGETCKQGDVLAVIGDLSGISVRIKANEFAINQLMVGQPVKVTGIAFKEHTLIGRIRHIDHQGEGSFNAQPTFMVEIAVPKLTDKQKKLIHVGMTANVEIQLASENHLMIPVSAIKEVKGVLLVERYDTKTKKIAKVAIQTGQTNLSEVSVLSGLKAGDHLVLPH